MKGKVRTSVKSYNIWSQFSQKWFNVISSVGLQLKEYKNEYKEAAAETNSN